MNRIFDVICLDCRQFNVSTEDEKEAYHEATVHGYETNHKIKIVHPK